MKQNSRKDILKNIARDILISLLVMFATFAICFLIRGLKDGIVGIPMIFILGVFMISFLTNGYLCGIICSFVSVFGVNYFVTYPNFDIDFARYGNSVTIISMLVVSIITSTLTTQIKRHEKIKSETETEKMRSNLLRSVSHDLRTPLTSILGASSAIIENDDFIKKDERIKLMTEIKDDAQWLIQIVENLLSITKINSNRETKIIKKPEIAEEVVADCMLKIRNRFPEFNVTVSVPDELLVIPMDAILIEQVLINLLENSAIHSKTATNTELRVIEKADCAIFEVQDNGVGIPNKLLPHIFDGYIERDYGSDADVKKNMGIGLSVCYSIIQAHGGEMSASNTAGGGALFKFTLPKKEGI